MNCLTVSLLVVAVLFGSVESAKWPEKGGRPCACTRLHFPVCGHDGQDYPNPDCAKRCGGIGYRIGSCDSLQPCNCPLSLQPVCGRTVDGTVRTFDNECQATCEFSATVVKQGDCGAKIEQPIYRPGGSSNKRQQRSSAEVRERKQYDSPCVCTQEYVPVCGLRAGKWTTYGNKCTAQCAGVDKTKPGPCGSGGGCKCGRIYLPVCGHKQGTLKTYPNQCTADCEEAVKVSDGRCPVAPDNSLPGKAKKSLPAGPAQLPVFPEDRYPAQLPVFPEDRYPAQLPVFPEDRYPAQLPVFPYDDDDDNNDDDEYDDDDDEDLVASQLPVFPNIFKRFFQ